MIGAIISGVANLAGEYFKSTTEKADVTKKMHKAYLGKNKR